MNAPVLTRYIAGEFNGQCVKATTLRFCADLQYRRVSAVYRLLRRKRIGFARGLELLAERHTAREMTVVRAMVELWRAHPIKDMLA